MTRQEEIRKGIERVLDELLFSPGESKDGYTYDLTGCVANLLKYLHSQCVVIKHGEGEADLWVEPIIEIENS